MRKNFKLLLSTMLLGATLFSTASFAAVVWQEGPNYVSNTEKFQYIYDGYGQCQSSYIFNKEKCIQVAIRYYGGASGDTGWLWSGTSKGDVKSVSHTYRDTLNPVAPQTKFRYDYYTIPENMDIQRAEIQH